MVQLYQIIFTHKEGAEGNPISPPPCLLCAEGTMHKIDKDF